MLTPQGQLPSAATEVDRPRSKEGRAPLTARNREVEEVTDKSGVGQSMTASVSHERGVARFLACLRKKSGSAVRKRARVKLAAARRNCHFSTHPATVPIAAFIHLHLRR